MKMFVTFLLLGLSPSVMAWNQKSNEDGATAETAGATAEAIVAGKDGAQVIFIGEDGTPVVSGVANANWISDDGRGNVVVEVVADEEDGNGSRGGNRAGVRTYKVKTKMGAEDASPDQGWLGVSIGSVPEALATQLDLNNQGVLVLNVVDGSPADAAGLVEHDILLSVNGQAVSSDVGRAVDLIKSRKPGEVLNIVTLRGGQQQTVNVKLGSRADLKDKSVQWKFEGSPDAEIEEHVKTHGKFMMRDPNGNWITRDLGDLHQLKTLPNGILAQVPESGSKSIQVFVENGKKNIKLHVVNDGTTVAIEQADGAISVTRIDANGNESKAEYENEDALKAGDEDAYNLFKEAGQSVTVSVDGDGQTFVFSDDEDDALGGGNGEWRMRLEESLSEAKDAYQKTMQELHQLMQQWDDSAPDLGQLDQLHQMLNRGVPGAHAFSFQLGKPKHSFTTRADGSIEVRIRSGDSELVQEFANESDLSARRPDLYNKFSELKSADQE